MKRKWKRELGEVFWAPPAKRKEEFFQSLELPGISFWEFLRLQIPYIRKWNWCIAVILFGMALAGVGSRGSDSFSGYDCSCGEQAFCPVRDGRAGAVLPFFSEDGGIFTAFHFGNRQSSDPDYFDSGQYGNDFFGSGIHRYNHFVSISSDQFSGFFPDEKNSQTGRTLCLRGGHCFGKCGRLARLRGIKFDTCFFQAGKCVLGHCNSAGSHCT